MLYLIAAQVARGAVIWTTNQVAKKVLKTITVACVTGYLVERHNAYKKKYERDTISTNK